MNIKRTLINFARSLLLAGLCFSAPLLASQPIFYDAFKDAEQHIILRVVYVTEDWIAYDELNAWDRAVEIKESDHVKYYEVAIWEETESVHLYAFDDQYSPYFAYQNPAPTSEEIIAHREQYRLMRFDNLPPKVEFFISQERSEALLEAFKAFSDLLVERHPNARHHLVYNGHGGPGGNLFEVQLLYNEVAQFLAHWTEGLGQRLGVIDMGGPCNKSGWSDLKNFCQYADYYIASDLANGGYDFDDWTLEKYNETNPDRQYHRIFADPYIDFEQALKQRLDITRQAYEYARQDMINKSLKQANYLYSCQKTRALQPTLEAFLGPGHSRSNGDLYQILVEKDASQALKDQVLDLIIHGVDNRDFFQWDSNHHGIIDW